MLNIGEPLDIDNSLTFYSLGSDEKAQHGEPLFMEPCQYCSPGRNVTLDAALTVFRDAFQICPNDAMQDGAQTQLWMLTPFTVLSIKNCNEIRKSMIFIKIYRTRTFELHTFTFSGEKAFSIGHQLMATVREALSDLTLSLFPEHRISVLPVNDVKGTHGRIMAGYLLKVRCEEDNICVVYGELRSPSSGRATFALYTNEQCTRLVDAFAVTSDMTLVSYESVNSNIFMMGDHFLCTRTLPEQGLWLRALINVKMMLMRGHVAEEVQSCRAGVLEQVGLLKIPEPSIKAPPRSFLPVPLYIEVHPENSQNLQSKSEDSINSGLHRPSSASRRSWSSPLRLPFGRSRSQERNRTKCSWMSRTKHRNTDVHL